MKEGDVIKTIITRDEAKVSLAWDESKSIVHYTNDFRDTEDAEQSAIGKLWQEYSDEIIAYIGRNMTLYTFFDTDKGLCSRCGITLPQGLPFRLTLHMCDPLRPIPFVTREKQK